jgi:Zn-dependent protease with chaperone function
LTALAGTGQRRRVEGPMFAETNRSARERRLFPLVLAIAAFGWLFILVALSVYLPCVDEHQLPDIHRCVARASAALGLSETPETWVVQSDGVLNAFATKFFSRRFVVLYSPLLDAAEQLGSDGGGGPDEVDFVIAHEVGHLAAGHLRWQT